TGTAGVDSAAQRAHDAAPESSLRESSVPTTVYLGLGGNVGDRRVRLAAALHAIARIVAIDAVSPVYASAPIGFADQPDFWNLVVRVHTTVAPERLLAAVKDIEPALGRTSTFRNGPREIDIDILLYDDVVRATSPVIPHPRMHERAFVLRPLADLDPTLRDPRDGERWTAYLDDVRDQRIEPVLDGALLLEEG
ncbi:MAG: 2-amino-4-hydroxy-6-hydroxymethyldihydropteridine diphosphokinase, partial [Longimicrobiales bacterium]